MSIPKNYFHDRVVLLLLAINTFLTVVGSIFILIRLDSGRGEDYFVQFRDNFSSNAFAFTRGTLSDVLSFIGFLVLVLSLHTVLSIRVYRLRRHVAFVILGMGTLLLTMTLIVSNALLVY